MTMDRTMMMTMLTAMMMGRGGVLQEVELSEKNERRSNFQEPVFWVCVNANAWLRPWRRLQESRTLYLGYNPNMSIVGTYYPPYIQG